MTDNKSKYAWEEWQLTAYLLGELEPDMLAAIKSAAEHDPQLAQQLKGLEQTLADVTSVLMHDGTAASDRTALASLYERVSSQAALSREAASGEVAGTVQTGTAETVTVQTVTVQTDTDTVQTAAYTGYTWKRLVSRWENWASLAGLILVGVLLYQRSGGQALQTLALENTKARNDATAASSPSVSASDRVDTSQAVAIGDEHHPDTPIEYIEDLDVVIVKGSKRDVQRTLDAIAQKNESASPSPTKASGSNAAGMSGGEGGQASGTAVDAFGMEPASPAPVAVTSPVHAQPGIASGPRPAKPSSPSIASASPSPGSEGGYGGDAKGAMDMGGAMSGFGGMEGGGMPGGMAGGMPGGYGMMGGTTVPASSLASGTSPSLRSDVFASEVARPFGLDREERRSELQPGDRFASFSDNEFLKVGDEPLSTFSIDVDTASYAKARQYLLEQRRLPQPASVRIEEFINYFDYEYAGPQDDKPFAASLAVTDCPWQPKHQLVRIALQAKRVERADRPKANLVFLLDVSGSMNEVNKLPLVKETMRLLTYQLTENDKVAMVVYAGAAGCVLDSTYGHEQDKILAAIERLNAGGSTNGGQGIELAYKLARENFIAGGINRVILCTDGDFNVGVTNTNDLVELVKEQAKSNVFLTVLGYGIGNTNDAMMEQIADRGNGLYGFVDSRREAERQMVKQLAGNLMTVAKDVKIQVEFNPAKVRSYRLVGYENRMLATEDFNNDKKDAGEIGAGHRVTAIYELVPVNEPVTETPPVDALRYQAAKRPERVAPVKLEDGSVSNELLAVKLRYKQPEGSESQLLTFPLEDKSVAYAEIDKDFRWAAAMAEFGMLLRNSPHKGSASWVKLSERARSALGNPVDTTRAETLEMINIASGLMQGR